MNGTRLMVCLLICFMVGCSSGGVAPSSPGYVQAQQFWKRTVTKCGSSWFGRGTTTPINIDEFKDFKFSVSKVPLDQADKLNGVQWRGITTVSCSSFRSFTLAGWGPWAECNSLPATASIPNRIRIDEINGRWFYISHPVWRIEANKYHPTPVNCNQVPK